MIRTKIIATMGPAVGTPETLYSVFEAGVDVCRLNFSHGTLEQHAAMLKLIRETAERFNYPIAVLGDLCGPKIRLGKIADVDGTGGMPVNVGDELIVQRGTIVGKDLRVSTLLETFVDDVNVGDRVLIEDGLLRFVVTDKNASEARLRCMVGGIVKSSKGINLPGTAINVPSITDRDWECVDWAVANGVDYLALSFVRHAGDLELLRGHLLYKKATNISLIAKIEKAEAVEEIDNIIAASDGLMVARGDLGVEMDVAQVPIIQKDLIRRCQKAGKPVIVATQMLQSMIDQASPTRAEVSDIANAIFDGTDAVMLSAETSVGKFPTVAVHTMAHTAEITEAYLDSHQAESAIPPSLTQSNDVSTALARGAWRIVNDLKAKLIVIWSQTGATARVFSKHHFHCPIVALSSDAGVLRRMSIHYGVIPQYMQRSGDMAQLFAQIDAMLVERKYAETGDRILIVAGWSPTTPSSMNGIIIHTVGDKWAALSPTGAKPGQETI
ncbi:MAG TPA: pyruvate kinase [Tepidisphaeraceae bacterium]|jgi:pyruvate kinase